MKEFPDGRWKSSWVGDGRAPGWELEELPDGNWKGSGQEMDGSLTGVKRTLNGN